MEQKVVDYIKSLDEYVELHQRMKDYIKEAKQVIAKYSVPYLKDDFDYYVAMSNRMRAVAAYLWKDKGLYRGKHSQFDLMIIK